MTQVYDNDVITDSPSMTHTSRMSCRNHRRKKSVTIKTMSYKIFFLAHKLQLLIKFNNLYGV